MINRNVVRPIYRPVWRDAHRTGGLGTRRTDDIALLRSLAFPTGTEQGFFFPTWKSRKFKKSAYGDLIPAGVDDPSAIELDYHHGDPMKNIEPDIVLPTDDWELFDSENITIASGVVSFESGFGGFAAYFETPLESSELVEVTINVASYTDGEVYLHGGIDDNDTEALIPINSQGKHVFLLALWDQIPGIFIQSLEGATLQIDSVMARIIPGNHRFAENAAYRPLVKADGFGQYLRYDSINDITGSLSSINWGTDEVTVIMVADVLSVNTVNMVTFGNTVNQNHSFRLRQGGGITRQYFFYSRGTTERNAQVSSNKNPFSSIFIGRGKITTDLCQIRCFGPTYTGNASDQGSGSSYGNHYMQFGDFGFYADERAFLAVNRLLDDPTIEQILPILTANTGIEMGTQGEGITPP